MLLEQESCNIYELFLDHLENIRKQNKRRAGGTDGATWATTATEGRGRSQWHRALVISTKLTEIAGTILVGTCSQLILYVLYHCKCLMCTSFVPLATGSGRLSSLIPVSTREEQEAQEPMTPGGPVPFYTVYRSFGLRYALFWLFLVVNLTTPVTN